MKERISYKLLAAILFSAVLHLAIIFLTTNGQEGKVQGKQHWDKLEVDIIDISPTPKTLPQMQEIPKTEPEAAPIANNKEIQPNAVGAIPLIEVPYYKVKELDEVPRPISSITPSYPENVPPSIRRGMVKLEIKLNEEGTVTEVKVLNSEPAGYFESNAVEAFHNAQFTPGMKNGRKVRSIFTLQIHFVDPQSL